ncbi:hypothetical protein ACFE04_021814 [Oxalis oulophora]
MNSIHSSRAIPKMGLLLLDEHGSRIEACIKGVAVQKFDTIMKEGDCYVISNCRLARNVDWTRLSDNKFKLNFICSTNIESILSTKLAEYRYDFVPFEEVVGRGNKNCYVIDVIGQLISVSHVIKGLSGGTETTSINIVLKDKKNHKLTCTLWDKYAEEVKSFMLNHNEEDHVIVILHLTKIHDRDISLSNYMTASRLIFNHDIPEVYSFMNIMIDAGNLTSQRLTKHLETSLDDVFSNPFGLKSIQYVKEVKEEGRFVIFGTVDRIDEEKGWFYETSVTRRDGPLCHICSGLPKVTIPRYKIELEVSDKSSSTTFVLYDDAATKFIDKTAFDSWGDDITGGQHEPIPKKIASLLNGSFLFEVHKSGINLIGNHKYSIMHLTSKEDLISKFISSNFSS